MELYKLNNLNVKPTEYYEIIENWIDGIPIQDLISKWKESIDKEVTDFHIFISKALYYLYPWGFSSFLQILAYKLSVEFKDLPENIKNLSSYIKYGLNNSTSCFSASSGTSQRSDLLLSS